MSCFTLDARVRVSIALALTAASDRMLLRDLEAEARRLGLCGAEIDAARCGRSFDALTARAVALALATRGSEGERRAERARAVRLGIADEVCREIEGFAGDLTVSAALAPDAPTCISAGEAARGRQHG
jgi:hypothetical protein